MTEPNDSPQTHRPRVVRAALFWFAVALVLLVANTLLLAVPGIALFAAGDLIATSILGPDLLPPIHGEEAFDIAGPMILAWTAACFALWTILAFHKPEKRWAARKWALYLSSLVACDVGLAAAFHWNAATRAGVTTVAQQSVVRTGPSLCEAARLGNVEALRARLQAGDSAGVRRDGFTPLMCAAEGCVACPPPTAAQDWEAAVRVLLQAGANPNDSVRDRGLRGTILMMAARRADGAPVVRALLEGGADPNLAGHRGETPLMAAVKQRNADIVRLLLARGANPLAKDVEGRTAAQLARTLAFPDIAKLLPPAR